MSTHLPVADAPAVKSYARTLITEYPRELGLVVVLYGATAVAGLAAPRLLGAMVQEAVTDKTTARVDQIAIWLAVFVLAQTAMTAIARYSAGALGEKVFARLREDFVRNVLDLPLSTVERAGSGDLLTRMVRDIDALSNSVRFAVPQTLIALVTTVLTVGALLLIGPVLAIPCLVSVPIIYYSTRWYLRRAPEGYIRENASYSKINSSLTETIDGARTVEELGTQAERVAQTDEDIRGSWKAERYTLHLRTVWFPHRRDRLHPAGGAHAAVRRRDVQPGPREHRPGDGGHPLRPATHRTGRSADLLAGRTPDRCGLDGPPPRCRAGPVGPAALG